MLKKFFLFLKYSLKTIRIKFDKDYRISYIVTVHLRKHRADNFLKDIVNGKSIAIVGNGPQQIGKNTGNEIDSADIVIRFNEFEITGYEKDYGEKVDIWFVGGFGKYNKEYYFETAKKAKIIVCRTIAKNLKNMENINFRYKCICDESINLTLFPEEFSKKDFKDLLGNDIGPTTGALAIAYILLHLKPKSLKFYGFSFLDTPIKDINPHLAYHYYGELLNEKKYRAAIDLRRESECLLKLLQNKNNFSSLQHIPSSLLKME